MPTTSAISIPSAAFVAYASRPRSEQRWVTVVEIALPQGTLYLGAAPFDRYENRVRSIGQLSHEVSLDGMSVPGASVPITLANNDRRIEQLLDGAYDARRAAVTIKRASPDLAASDWDPRFTGILKSWGYNTDGPDTVTLACSADDHVLRNSWAPGIAVRKAEWGEGSYVMPDGVDGIYAPYLYGSHLSSGVASKQGFVPLICVGQTGATGRYLACFGRLKAKTGTWKASDGSSVSGTLEYVSRGGKVFTTVNYTSGISAGLELRGDFDGYEGVGDGSGTLISNPVRQLWHLLTLIYADWRNGSAWPALTAAPIDTASWAACADWCDRYKLEGSAYIGGTADQQPAKLVIERWMQSFPFRLHWNELGKLRMVNLLGATEHPGLPTSSSYRLSRESQSPTTTPRLEHPQDDSGLARQVSATHLYSAAENKSFGSLDVQDPSVIEKVVTNIRMDWSLSRAA